MNHQLARTVLLVIVLLLGTWSDLFGEAYTVSGSIRDSATGEPLVAATIRVLGSTKGTISNTQGNYRLTLAEGEYTLVFSFVGYKTDSVFVHLHTNTMHDVRLEPSPIQLAEVVVTGEDPAIAIMRRVIENKKKWAEKLTSYQLEAFTRQTILRDTAIAVITESYSTCYWQRGDTLREVIRQKRQTENIKGTQNFASVGGILNFYEDEIRLAGFTFVGPTSPRTFDYYDFKLERMRRRTGANIYDIKLIPKTRLVPLFRGTISIAEGSYAVAGISVSPNEAFVIPFVSELTLSYAQQFSLFEDEYWMPVDIRINGFFRVGLTGLTLPGIGIESISSIYDCKVNPTIPDSIFRKPRRIVLKEAEKFDSTFWAEHDVLPLTSEEKTAYVRLDSSQTLEKQFQPSGPLVTVGDLLGASPISPRLRFNRVEGLYVGVSLALDSVTNKIAMTAEAGYGFADKHTKERLGLDLFIDQKRSYSIGAEVYRDVNHFLDGKVHNDLENLFSTLLYKIDYFDYYFVKGFSLSFSAKPITHLTSGVGYRNEDQSSAVRSTNYSFFSRDRVYEANPSIAEGTMRAIWFKVHYGEEALPVPVISKNYVEAEADRSSPQFASSFNYTQIVVRGKYHIATYLRSLFLPPTLSIGFSSGTSFGTLPPQRYFYLDSPLLGYAPSGILRGARIREFSGDTYFILTLEHNFRSTPFLWMNVPFLYRNSIEFLVYGTVARSWKYANSAPIGIHPTDGLYTEAGCSISRILGVFRIDYTYRIAAPQRSVLTLGIATLL